MCMITDARNYVRFNGSTTYVQTLYFSSVYIREGRYIIDLFYIMSFINEHVTVCLYYFPPL